MPGLLDLPEELLLAIVKALRDIWAIDALQNLAIVSKRFTPLVRVVFVKDASICILKDDSPDRPKHLVQFLTCLQRYPELLNCLDWIKLAWERRRFTKAKAYNDIVEIIGHSRTLRRLSIDLASRAQLAKVPVLFHPPPGSFCNLEWIDVDVTPPAGLPADHMANICELPNLQRISNSISNVVECSSAYMLETPETHFRSTPLNLRCLESTAPMTHIDYLKLVLPRAKHIEALHISLPGPGVTQEPEWSEFASSAIPDFDHKFSPHEIGRCLNHAARTLEELSITSLRHHEYNFEWTFVNPVEHDNSYLDLSSFERLHYLKASSYLFFGPYRSAADTYRQKHRKLWELLPPHLEELHINFEGHQGIFASLQTMFDRWVDAGLVDFAEYFVKYWTPEVASRFNDPTQLAWLYDILEQSSAGRFPNLTTIVLEECYSTYWGDWKRIDVAELHPKIANHKIQVAIRVLVPKDVVVECLDVLRSFGFTGGIDTSVEDAVMADLISKGLINDQ
ncbi:hypothetical protein LTR24_006135 [Lithohypha guttulata]|uniref:F-box domain-containing protein n=1 Tax=Lithohypha guttulata TaxID=1690604 RepID=A0ABR0K6R7_9EURO|nr:hypothetical protein LTR24_006135 [Lithohypha guttulata]